MAQFSTVTDNAAEQAVDALELDDTTVSAWTRRLGVDWHAAWAGTKVEAGSWVADSKRLEESGPGSGRAHLEAVAHPHTDRP
ncbi:hypothetical protein [Arthrobacter sp. AZCC_0090]|uniref:hypothetical protein n=1 Tax=Arthrobacter sp. AZCC_0090 TaxID=2735881 RepID=UPI00161436F2|nr:hypothetical protein [Arthrobacter sp. AZCC_0090]MBB6407117.1 hypothetical protein [Arthrobacter sp. AZCC_0090]